MNPFKKKKKREPEEMEKFDLDLWQEYYFLSVKELQSQKKMHDKAIQLSRKREKKMGYTV